MSLPPGATLVSGEVPMALPPGATLVSGASDSGTPTPTKPQAFPLTQQQGESYDDFMDRAVQRAKQLTPDEMKQAEASARDPKKIAAEDGSDLLRVSRRGF